MAVAIGALGHSQLEADQRVRRRGDGVAPLAECPHLRRTDRGIVFDDQHCGHALTLTANQGTGHNDRASDQAPYAFDSRPLSLPYQSNGDTGAMRRGLVMAAGWVGAVAAAFVFGIATLGVLDTPGGPLSQHEVSERLAQTPPATPIGPASPEPGLSPTAGADPARQYLTTSGGSVWASCAGGQARLETMTPRQGFRLDGYDRGPATAVWVRFKQEVQQGHGAEYQATVTCADGVPQVRESVDN